MQHLLTSRFSFLPMINSANSTIVHHTLRQKQQLHLFLEHAQQTAPCVEISRFPFPSKPSPTSKNNPPPRNLSLNRVKALPSQYESRLRIIKYLRYLCDTPRHQELARFRCTSPTSQLRRSVKLRHRDYLPAAFQQSIPRFDVHFCPEHPPQNS